MVTPHLPPEQSANALLPVMLAAELEAHGVESRFVTHPPSEGASDAGVRQHALHASYVPRRGRSRFERTVAGAVAAGVRMGLGSRRAVRDCDLVHLHSNGFVIEIAALLARRYRKPYVITLYGTDIWHHDAVRHGRFGRVVRQASCRVFYSRGLRDFARGLGLASEPSPVIYAPVPPGYHDVGADERASIRRAEATGTGPVLLTVKRLHRVAGHEDLLLAMPRIIERYRDVRLWLIGEGEERPRLEQMVQDLGIRSHVTLLGLRDNTTLSRYYAAADLFVLPSRLESWGAVMLEALACGTPVVATNTAGGLEVQALFPQDVTVTAREDPDALAAAVCQSLARRSRTGETTRNRLRSEFSVSACARQYLDVYRSAIGRPEHR
jgi:glycosyltransferase involved in cell wall biosynthesis